MKQKINIENYESFFLDYLDGNLSNQEIIDLEDFLYRHPDLREELEGLENVQLKPETTPFPVKENLFAIDLSKPVNKENFVFYCVAEMEGDLEEPEIRDLQTFMSLNPEFQNERKKIQATRLDWNEIVSYPGKEKLKKSPLLIYRKEWITLISVAAGILLLISFWLGFVDNNPEINSMAGLNPENVENPAPVDSAVINQSEQKNILKETTQEPSKPANNIPVSVKKEKSSISFKTGIPVASVNLIPDSVSGIIPEPSLSAEDLIHADNINTGLISQVSILNTEQKDTLRFFNDYIIVPNNTPQDPSDYMSISEFAYRKISKFIFKEEDRELNVITLASAGINKINDAAGTNMKLEEKPKSESGKKVISFNSKIISFSAPINRED